MKKVGLVLIAVFVALSVSACQGRNSGSQETAVPTMSVPKVVPTVRIPGKGSQDDHSGGVQFARVEVHDNEPANEFGWYDRTVVNTIHPGDIGLEDNFTVPEGWSVERDYSLSTSSFQPYYTVKPLPTTNIETINTWAEENDFQSMAYEVTSVVVHEETGQECSVRGLDEDRVRINIYVGENFVFQLCPPTDN